MSLLDINNGANKGYSEKVNGVDGSKQIFTNNVIKLCQERPEVVDEAKIYTGTGAYSDDSIINSMKKEAPTQTLGM